MSEAEAPQPAVQMERMIDGWFIAGMEDDVCPYQEGSLAWKWWHRGEAAALAEGALSILKSGASSGDLDNAAEQAISSLEGAAH